MEVHRGRAVQAQEATSDPLMGAVHSMSIRCNTIGQSEMFPSARKAPSLASHFRGTSTETPHWEDGSSKVTRMYDSPIAVEDPAHPIDRCAPDGIGSTSRRESPSNPSRKTAGTGIEGCSQSRGGGEVTVAKERCKGAVKAEDDAGEPPPARLIAVTGEDPPLD